MELKTMDIVEAAGRIINESGINNLSIGQLAREMKIDESTLYPYFKQDEDILMLLLVTMGDEINQLITETRFEGTLPDQELRLLFENIHQLLEIKPYYLSAIFFIQLKENNTALQNTMVRIKIDIRAYVLDVINRGKNDLVFKNKMSSKSLGNYILKSFRSFMNEQRKYALMVKDLERLKTIEDSDNLMNIYS